ncbi:MAG: FAD:protein FMN transferase [Firmicutes bacterium]|nr:FAD:protein FMN transferase [Bacillota bacterium]
MWFGRRWVILILAAILIAGVFFVYERGKNPTYEKYTDSFMDTFDTVTIIVGYTSNEKQFKEYFNYAHKRFQELHRYYDIYQSYSGVNNVKTINENAGIRPVEVAEEIVDMILFSKKWYALTEGKTNIALGPVLGIWHDYRDVGRIDPAQAKLPPVHELQAAAEYSSIDDIIVDEQKGTVFLPDGRMRLDVGAVAKGYATELVALELEEMGFDSCLISAGGNIRGIGKPLDDLRERWGVGIQDPRASVVADDGLLDVVFINNASVVTSGDYQRYYVVDGRLLHHIIDPETLMPGDYYQAVSVVAEDSGVADFLSTELFLLPLEKSKKLVESLPGVEALWVLQDGTVEVTEGMAQIMRSRGASGAEPH